MIVICVRVSEFAISLRLVTFSGPAAFSLLWYMLMWFLLYRVDVCVCVHARAPACDCTHVRIILCVRVFIFNSCQ
jgi:hypothetical protein